MNLIPLSYLRGERYRKWLKNMFIIGLLIGCIGSGMSILLPFKITTLQEEIETLKRNDAFDYREAREEVLGGIYEKEEVLKVLEEERQKINLEKKAYFLDLEYIFSLSQTMISLHQVIYNGHAHIWEVVGSSKELEYIKLYKESLLGVYGEQRLNFKMEKEGEEWFFSFKLAQDEEEWNETLE